MSDSMHQWWNHANPLAGESREPPHRKQRFQVPLIELVRPDGYWPQPFSIEQAFEILRWMVTTGASKPEYTSRHQWGTVGVMDLLTPGSGIGHGSIQPVTSLEDLRHRFHRAILARPASEGQALWREDFGIGPTGKITVRSPVFEPMAAAPHLGWQSEQAIHDDLVRMFSGSAGTETAVSLNSVHTDCRTVHGLRVSVDPKFGFALSLRFGNVHPSEFGSSWDFTIARTREGESFLDTFARARDVWNCLVHGQANDCDTGDFNNYYQPEHVLGQIDTIHTRAPVEESAASAPAP